MEKIYGLKITITRSDLPGTELTVDMPEIGGQEVRDANPAINALLKSFEAILEEQSNQGE